MGRRILRGEIYWANLNPVKGKEQAGYRPVLVLSQDIFNEKSGIIIALAITSKEPKAGFPLTLKIKTVELPKPSWVKLSQIRTLSSERLERRLGMIDPRELEDVIEGLLDIIG